MIKNKTESSNAKKRNIFDASMSITVQSFIVVFQFHAHF